LLGRIGRLEDRYQFRKKDPLSIGVLLVHSEDCAGGLSIETDKPTEHVPPTQEEVEKCAPIWTVAEPPVTLLPGWSENTTDITTYRSEPNRLWGRYCLLTYINQFSVGTVNVIDNQHVNAAAAVSHMGRESGISGFFPT
jgi:hypothetical protein